MVQVDYRWNQLRRMRVAAPRRLYCFGGKTKKSNFRGQKFEFYAQKLTYMPIFMNFGQLSFFHILGGIPVRWQVAPAGGPVLHLWPAKWSQKVSQIISVTKFERFRALARSFRAINIYLPGGVVQPPLSQRRVHTRSQCHLFFSIWFQPTFLIW